MFEKQFFNKMKTITYNAETRLKAEKYFSTIQHSKLNGSSVKFPVGGVISLFPTHGVNTRRGTPVSMVST